MPLRKAFAVFRDIPGREIDSPYESASRPRSHFRRARIVRIASRHGHIVHTTDDLPFMTDAPGRLTKRSDPANQAIPRPESTISLASRFTHFSLSFPFDFM
jgi:hypothetical protein